MSWQMTAAVKVHLRGVDPVVKLLAFCLADYASPEGDDIYPSVSTLAEDVGVSERTIQRHMAELVSIGFIKLIEGGSGGSHPVRQGGKRKGKTNRYRINPDWWKRCGDNLTGHQREGVTEARDTPTDPSSCPDTAVSPEYSREYSKRGEGRPSCEGESQTAKTKAETEARARLRAMAQRLKQERMGTLISQSLQAGAGGGRGG